MILRKTLHVASFLLILSTIASAGIQNVHGCAKDLSTSAKYFASNFRVFTDCGNTTVKLQSFLGSAVSQTLSSNTGSDCIADFHLDPTPVDKVVITLMPSCTGTFGSVTITYAIMAASNALMSGPCLLNTAPCIAGIGASKNCSPPGGGCAPVPTLPQWGLIALVVLLVTLGFTRI